MTEFPYVGGVEVSAIENREFQQFETAKAKEIVLALDRSNIPFFAKYSGSAMVLVFDKSYTQEVENIVKKSNSGNYEILLRELKMQKFPDNYLNLLPEIAEILHTTVGTLQARPQEIQIALCKIFVDFWFCDTATIQRELDRIITVNGRTLQDIQEHETEKSLLKNADVQPKIDLYVEYRKRAEVSKKQIEEIERRKHL